MAPALSGTMGEPGRGSREFSLQEWLESSLEAHFNFRQDVQFEGFWPLERAADFTTQR